MLDRWIFERIVSEENEMLVNRFFVRVADSWFLTNVQRFSGANLSGSDLRQRGGVFVFIASQIRSISARYRQHGNTSLNGKYGMGGWRWLYIFCKPILPSLESCKLIENCQPKAFACTVPIAILGFVLLPSNSDACRPSILTEIELPLARERMAAEHRETGKPIKLGVIKN
jgi:hypothetical protein